ncbi:MAG TPA: hypothetical protein ACYCC7_00680 [Candidatus Azoamicus sp. MARI]
MYKIFLVGGLIRDKLITLKANEKDWVILNSNYKTILTLGFKLVGKDFPVFLHPITKEEYALARKERKIKLGYNGFKCYFFSSIKLKDDLFRRDITINSIILNKNGKIIDFFNGINDIKNKKIRNISNAFFEDPLRILRVARLSLKYYNFGFTLTSKTYKLIKTINKKEINNLTTERIQKEIFTSIKFKNEHIFFNVIKICDKLKSINYSLNFLIDYSTKFKFNTSLNYWSNTIKLLKKINIYTNNKFIKISIIINAFIKFNKLEKYNFLNISKKYTKFILDLSDIKNKYEKISCTNFNDIKNLLENISINKNKIKILNIILICNILTEVTSYTYNFYTKYIVLETIDKINKKIKKNTHNVYDLKTNKIKENINKMYNKLYII